MALIHCPECSKEVSDQAESCPNCGVSIKPKQVKVKMSRKTKIFTVVIAAVVIIGGSGAIIGNSIYQNSLEKERIAEEQRLEEERLEAERIAEEERIVAENQYEADITLACALMRYWGLVCELEQAQVSRLWSETINGGKRGVSFNDPDTGRSTKSFTDFNDTIRWFYGLKVTKSIMDSLIENDNEMAEYMTKLQNPPEKYKDAYDAFLDMYEIYVQTSDLAQSPSGSLQTFNSTQNSLSANFSSAYARVKVLLPAVEEKVSDIEDEEAV